MTDIYPTIIYPVPWDVTTSFGHGTHGAPAAIQSIYHQLDPNHPFQPHPVHLVFRDPNPIICEHNNRFAKTAHAITATAPKQSAKQKQELEIINAACAQLPTWVYNDVSREWPNPVVLCGGEHGVGIGYIRALADHYSAFSILQIDTHMDCRTQYMGFDFSHASVMTYYANCPAVTGITQVGIRDYDATEVAFQKQHPTPFHVFYDYTHLHRPLLEGETWANIVNAIIDTLDDHVVISLDIDGLAPYLGNHTGTPMPGGLSYNQLLYLLETLYKKRRIIGAELVEVNPYDRLNTVVGTRLLQVLSGVIHPH
jgi:agmatinase